MRLASATAVLVALSTACSSPTSDATGFSELRVCTAAAFDEDEARCTRDESGSPLTAGRFYCSATIEGTGGARSFSGRFAYEGEPLPRNSRPLPENASTGWLNVFTGGDALPGGSWSCELRLGDTVATKRFESGGPDEPVLDVASCPTEQTTEAGPARVCDPDGVATTIAPTPSVTCSATFVGASGKEVRLDLLHRGEPTDVTFTRRLPLPVTAFGVQIEQNDGNLPSGPYTCVFSVDGERVAEQAFEITS